MLQITPQEESGTRLSRSGVSMVLHRQISLDSPLRWGGGSDAKTRKVKSKQKRNISRPVTIAPLTQAQLEMQASSLPLPRAQKKDVKKQLRSQASASRPGANLLEEAAVSKACLARYAAHWEEIKNIVTNSRGQLKAMATIDKLVAAHLEEMYKDGEDISSARYRVAAMIFYNPSLKSPSMINLPRVKQSLKGWSNLAPARSRMPLPWEVTCLLVKLAFEKKLFQVGLQMLVMFALYLRPSEALRIRCCDIVPPAHRHRIAYKFYTVVLHPEEEGVPSKTKEYDETLALDLPFHHGIGDALMRHMGNKHGSKTALLFNHRYRDLTKFLDEATDKLQLERIAPVHPYRFRHGGASHDYSSKNRDLMGIMQRGRWKSMSSVKRYQKGARLTQVFAALPEQVQRASIQAADNLSTILQQVH